ncbi:MAG: ribosome maturation factor RimM [Actinomycetota bacterium]|jgi:16S rRNA processing protein RimM
MRLNVGRIGRAHGILGEATIEVRTDLAEERFAIGAQLETDSHGVLTVESARVHNGILLLGFSGISDRNSVEKLRDVLLYSEVDIDEPGFEEDDYHVLQLIGCKAYLVDGDLLGEVTEVLNLPGQDVLSIKSENGEVLIPFVHQLVPIVDIKAKRMTVIPPDFYSNEAK